MDHKDFISKDELIQYVNRWLDTHSPRANVHLFKHISKYKNIKDILHEYGFSLQEQLYNLIHNQEVPTCDLCCVNSAKFISLHKGYNRVCSRTCGIKLAHKEGKFDYEKRGKTFKERFGKNSPGYEKLREKIHKTSIKNFNTDHPSQSDIVKTKYKNTCNERYCADNPMQNDKIKEKVNKTNIKKFGGIRPLCNESIKTKMTSSHQDTMQKRYGVNFVSHVPRFFDKMQNNFTRSHFKNLHYQFNYEHDFIDIFYDKIEIQNGKSFWYMVNEIKKLYYSDFYIPSKNLIIEIKSSYYYKRDRDIIIMKALAVLKSGYEFMIIIDKDYSYFKKYLGI